MRGEAGWQKVLERWQVRLVLLEPGRRWWDSWSRVVGSCSTKMSGRWYTGTELLFAGKQQSWQTPDGYHNVIERLSYQDIS